MIITCKFAESLIILFGMHTAWHMHSYSYDFLQLEIPSKDTTYWCSVHLLPEEIRRHEKHMYKVRMHDGLYGPFLLPLP